MKKFLFLTCLLLTTTIQAQTPKYNNTHQTNWDYVVDVQPVTWTKQITTSVTNNNDGDKTATTLAGAAVGHWLFKGSLVGTLVGAAVGNSAGDESSSTTTNTVTNIEVKGYQVTMSRGAKFKTTTPVHKWQQLDIMKINKE